jgi:hypothetical protein
LNRNRIKIEAITALKNMTIYIFSLLIPKLLEDVCFRTFEELMIKAPHFIKDYSEEYAPAFSNKLHPCSVLKNEITKNMFCSYVPAGLV